jgi:hypothetical protein
MRKASYKHVVGAAVIGVVAAGGMEAGATPCQMNENNVDTIDDLIT